MEIVKSVDKKSNEKPTFPPLEIESFGASDVIELCIDYHEEKCALKSFGILLASSDLEMFAGDYEGSVTNRTGLEQIINLYIDQQGRRIDKIRKKAENSPERIISKAEASYNNVNSGMFNDHKTGMGHIQKAIWRVEQIISKFGIDEYPKADKVLQKLLKLEKTIEPLLERENNSRRAS